MAVKNCIKCEGNGVLRNYLNRAGDYEKTHCTHCDGTGKSDDCSCRVCTPEKYYDHSKCSCGWVTQCDYCKEASWRR